MSLAYKKSGKKDEDQLAKARFVEVKEFGASMASQSFADEVDINKIMARVQKGHPVLTSNGQPFYGDVSEFGGLQESLIKVQEANDLFMQFPANVREKFDNDPVNFVEFMSDPKNTKKAIDLGLATALPEPVVPEPPVTPASAPPASK